MPLPPQRSRARESLASSYAALGGILEDIELGLVDFHHPLEGVDVLLCWQFGERSVLHFHPVGSGFSGRCRLPGVFEIEPPH